MTSVGIMASSVAASGVDVLLEPFNNFTFAPWTLVAPNPTIVAGRNGNAAQVTGTLSYARYAIPTINQDAVVTVGCAWRSAAFHGTADTIINLCSDANATQHTDLRVNNTGGLIVSRFGTSLATAPSAGLAINTWYYLEIQFTLGDSPNGAAMVRVNGTEVINATGLDTKNAGTKTVYDTVRLGVVNSSSGGTHLYDDLYITVGAGAAFKGDIVVP